MTSRCSFAGLSAWLACLACLALPAAAADSPAPAPAFETGVSVLRVIGGFLFVVGLFLGAAWLVRRWPRQGGLARRQPPRLRILESRSLGARQTLYVVGYDHQRFLVSASPAGLQLVSPLPEEAAPAEAAASARTPAVASFAEALQHVLARS